MACDRTYKCGESMNWLEFIYEESNLNEFLDKLQDCYQAGFWVMDNAFNLMGASQEARRIYERLEESHTIIQVIESLQYQGLNQLLARENCISHYSDITGETCFIGDCVVSGHRIAKVTCFYKQDSLIDQADFVECVKAITIFLQMQKGVTSYSEDRNLFFHHLLHDPNPSSQYIQHHLYYHQIKLTKPYVLIAASEWGDSDSLRGELSYYLKIFKSIFASALFDMNDKFVIACVSMKDLDHHYEALIRMSERNKMKLWIGTPYVDEKETYAYYQQMKRLQQLSSSTEIVSWYKDYVMDDLFAAVDSHMDLNTMIDLEVQQILDYDKSNHTDYFRTAYLLLCESYSQVEVAHKLNIHINTLKYRMKQLEHLFDLNLTEAKNDHWIRFSFHILKYKQHV